MGEAGCICRRACQSLELGSCEVATSTPADAAQLSITDTCTSQDQGSGHGSATWPDSRAVKPQSPPHQIISCL